MLCMDLSELYKIKRLVNSQFIGMFVCFGYITRIIPCVESDRSDYQPEAALLPEAGGKKQQWLSKVGI